MDDLLAKLFNVPRSKMDAWITPGRYVTGREMANEGLPALPALAPWRNAVDAWRQSLLAHPDLGTALRAYALGKARNPGSAAC
jgi:hypothetical protein